jgi:hypothetical protein
MAIDKFLATVRTAGLAKSSKYMVVIDLPRGPIANSNGVINPWNEDFFQRNNNNAYNQLRGGQQITSLYCEAASLPSLNIDTKMNKVYGPGREMPYGRSYTPVNLTFYIDNDYVIKKFFDTWMNTIFDGRTSHMNYYNEYTTQVHILALDARGDNVPLNPSDMANGFNASGPSTLRARYQCTLEEAYPKTVAEVTYGAGNAEVARLQVSMQYRKWTETTTREGVGSLSSNPDLPFNISYNPATGTTAIQGVERPRFDPSNVGRGLYT